MNTISPEGDMAREAIARIIDPSAWVMEDGYWVEQEHSDDAFAKADAVLALSAHKASVEPADGAREALAKRLEAECVVRENHSDDYCPEITGMLRECLAALRSPAVDAAHQNFGVQSDYVMVPRELTAENGAKAALIGEFHEEFGFLDEDGAEQYAKVAVTWTTIKAVHKMMVAHFAALSLPEKAEGWQPIETAPKDGTKIDVWLTHREGKFEPYRKTDVWWTADRQDDLRFWTWDGQWHGRLSPHVVLTHWMPRPSPPLSSAHSRSET